MRHNQSFEGYRPGRVSDSELKGFKDLGHGRFSHASAIEYCLDVFRFWGSKLEFCLDPYIKIQYEQHTLIFVAPLTAFSNDDMLRYLRPWNRSALLEIEDRVIGLLRVADCYST